jgi:hypothetical protein
MISGSIYFLGKYRPAYFEAQSVYECQHKMWAAMRPIKDKDLWNWLAVRVLEGRLEIEKDNCSAWTADHCDRGISFAKRPHDPFMDKAVADMPPCPGLDYSQSLNA